MPKWSKMGRVFVPDRQFDWMNSHAAVPFAEHIQDNYFYVYFSCRDKHNRSHTARLTAEISNRFKVLDLLSYPIISPGELGCFDDDGAMLSWISRVGEYNYYYYIGWNRSVTVPFRNSVGLVVGRPGQVPARLGKGPILDRTFTEPHFVASVCVLPGAERWQAWYLSCTGWDLPGGNARHRYHIKYATSDDGISWQRDGLVSIDYKDESEYAISRPSVLYFGGRMEMWYSFRGKKYRIGYAHSEDGLKWNRDDKYAGIDVSEVGWDSDMIEYPHVFMHNEQCYMLYNGNDYGKSGFGLAIREP